MRKYYIPTSSLNFNNILSSESISPKAFYAARGFGYDRWTEIPENGVDNVVLLYADPFVFERPHGDLEDHPMFVEICSDEEFKALGGGLYRCDHTIYLSPWRAKFCFFSEHDKKATLSLSSHSLETKFSGIYSCCVLEQLKRENKPYLPNGFTVELNHDAIERDYKLNKLKGLLYGYYIGALLSMEPRQVAMYNCLHGLGSIFSAVLSSVDRTFAAGQRERMYKLIESFYESSPKVRAALERLKNSKTMADCRAYALEYINNTIDAHQIENALTTGNVQENTALAWLSREQKRLEQGCVKSRKPLLTGDSEIIVLDGHLKKISNHCIADGKENELFKLWVNEVLMSKDYDGSISAYNCGLSDVVTKAARDRVWREEWESCKAKQLLNAMRRYIHGGNDDFEWGDNLYSAMAVVLAKGDDWQKMRDFMITKGLADYRLAFAIYGELNGFANLTRDFTDYLLRYTDQAYVADVYCEIYGQLHEADPRLPGALRGDAVELPQEASGYASEAAAENTQDGFDRDAILNYVDGMKNSKAKKSIKDNITSVLTCSYRYATYHDFFDELSKKDWCKTSKGLSEPFKKMVEHFCPNHPCLQKNKRGSRQQKPRNAVNNNGQQQLHFSGDDSSLSTGWPELESLKHISDQNVINRLKENWDFTVRDDGGVSAEQIRHFVNVCNKEHRGEISNHYVLKSKFKLELAERVREELLQKLCGNGQRDNGNG